MASTFTIIVLIICLPSLAFSSSKSLDSFVPVGCYCVAESYGCLNDDLRKGYCDRRCCIDSKSIDHDTGERPKQMCKCVSSSSTACPAERPNESGRCSGLIECCPSRIEL